MTKMVTLLAITVRVQCHEHDIMLIVLDLSVRGYPNLGRYYKAGILISLFFSKSTRKQPENDYNYENNYLLAIKKQVY